MVRLAYLTVFVAVAIAIASLDGADMANITSGSALSVQTTNITITGLSIPSNVSSYSPLPVFFNLTNTGRFASGNMIVNLQIYGSPEINLTFNFSALSPGQSELVLLYLNNATRGIGGHTVYLSSQYRLGGATYQTGRAVGGYTVVNSNFAGYEDSYSGIGSMPNVSVTYAPLVDYLIKGSGLLSQMTMFYNGSTPASVNIKVPGTFSQIVSLSANSLYLLPGQSLSTSILLNAGTQPYGTAYTVPIALTEMRNGASKGTQVRYIQIYTLNDTPNIPIISGRVFLSNNSRSSTGVVQINSPANYSLYDSRLQLTIPSSAAPNASMIDAYGSQEQVMQDNGSYVIEWDIGDIQKNQVIYLYYDIADLENPGALVAPQFMLSSVTRPTQSSDFNITGTVLPVFYVNSTEQVEINLLYTGSAPASAIFFMPSTSGAAVTNSTHVVNVVPNQQLQETFSVTARNYTGTALLKLYVVADGVNSTYDFPIIILQRPTNLPSLLLYLLTRFRYPILAIILIVGAALAYGIKRERRPKKYDPERARQLIHLREQMNRDSG